MWFKRLHSSLCWRHEELTSTFSCDNFFKSNSLEQSYIGHNAPCRTIRSFWIFRLTRFPQLFKDNYASNTLPHSSNWHCKLDYIRGAEKRKHFSKIEFKIGHVLELIFKNQSRWQFQARNLLTLQVQCLSLTDLVLCLITI